MEARTNELIQGILRWYNIKDVVPSLEAIQKKDCLLPRQRYRYDEAWLYINKLG